MAHKKAVKKIIISIEKESHHLQFIEILTQQDDATRYWFYDVKTNVELPADIFTPSSGSASVPPIIATSVRGKIAAITTWIPMNRAMAIIAARWMPRATG